MPNPLLQLGAVPDFERMQASDIGSALKCLIKEAKQALEQVAQEKEDATWDNTIVPLDESLEKLGRAWGVVSHLNAVKDHPAWRAAYNAHVVDISHFYTALAQDFRLFERYQSLAQREGHQLTDEQQRVLTLALQDFKLAGAQLLPEKREELATLSSELSVLESQFSQNVQDATDAFGLWIDEQQELAGVPHDILALFKQAAAVRNRSGYFVGLQTPFYLAIMRHAHKRELRKKIHYAYATRASELGDQPQWDNTDLISTILQKRQKEASLLGYAHYAELSLVKKMAKTPQQIMDLAQQLLVPAKKAAQQEFAELTLFAQQQLGMKTLAPWDIAFASEQLRQQRYAFSEAELANYFELSSVLGGLFQLIKQLYQVDFVEEVRPVWEQTVKYFHLLKNQTVIGGLYLDLYAREGKRGGAWMNDYCNRWQKKDTLQLPIVYVVCNFAPPDQEGKSHLQHEEIVTLFHEMGHALHALLTTVKELDVSGISGVEWDAVELPSQLMENFAWQWDVLHAMSQHRESKEALPRTLFDRLLAARNFQVGLKIIRQLSFLLFDLRIHLQEERSWMDIYQEIQQQLSVLPQTDYDRFPHAFTHIFSGSYAAGYYSYLWAEVLSADAYGVFRKIKDRKKVGQRFWQEILSRGGSRPADQSFVAFVGREPTTKALLEQLGLYQRETSK